MTNGEHFLKYLQQWCLWYLVLPQFRAFIELALVILLKFSKKQRNYPDNKLSFTNTLTCVVSALGGHICKMARYFSRLQPSPIKLGECEKADTVCFIT